MEARMSSHPNSPEMDALSREAIQAFDELNGGVHAGFRPAHAKGILLSGTFTPSPEVSSLTRAPHVSRPSIRVAVRFSDFAGIPTVADNETAHASPRGMATRFYLSEHQHTDIIAHSENGFPVRTAEEFVEFLHAIKASGPDAPHPTPVEKFFGSHPAALAFVQAPQPIPTSFARETFFGVSAYKFSNAQGVTKFGRYRIVPEAGGDYLDAASVAKQSPDFLFDELKSRIAREPVKMRILVQIAAEGDVTDDSTQHWPESRPFVDFGTLELNAVVEQNDEEQRRIIFDPIPRVDGIESSADPLLEPRAAIYLASGRRRRSAPQAQTAAGAD
jgi:catalase